MVNCVNLEESVVLTEDVVAVRCQNSSKNVIYSNTHSVIRRKSILNKRIDVSQNPTQIRILLVGVDSVSRLNFMREMPKTFQLLQKNQWTELKGFNKIGDNTFPNIMGILSGMNESDSYSTCVSANTTFNDCDLIWYDYRKSGYITAFLEDEASINTFNYNRNGFMVPPTDCYFRPYVLALEKFERNVKIDDLAYCTGPEATGERVLTLIKNFVTLFSRYPYFGFFWMNSFSHNELNSVSRMDTKIHELLDYFTNNHYLDNTIVFFFSDHGLRFGKYRFTIPGWYEERLPFFYVHLPKLVREGYPTFYHYLTENQNKLTTPYDIYMTLQHILEVSDEKFTSKSCRACPKCNSLFKEIGNNRSCNDAAINHHWCTCLNYKKFTNKSVLKKLIDYVIQKIHQTIQSFGKKQSSKCHKFKYDKTILSTIFRDSKSDPSYLILIFRAKPGSTFEATVRFNERLVTNFSLVEGISRLDWYSHTGRCVQNGLLKKYCYCK